jgi:hypothetical protein
MGKWYWKARWTLVGQDAKMDIEWRRISKPCLVNPLLHNPRNFISIDISGTPLSCSIPSIQWRSHGLNFTYFRTRFEEKLQPQNAFLSRLMLLDRKNIFVSKTLYCTYKYNNKITRCLRFWSGNYIVMKRMNFELWLLLCRLRKFKFKCAFNHHRHFLLESGF